jgi:hypothetical protein
MGELSSVTAKEESDDAEDEDDEDQWGGIEVDDDGLIPAQPDPVTPKTQDVPIHGRKVLHRIYMYIKLNQYLGTRYVPPHLRLAAAKGEDSEELARLSKQLKGLLNRYCLYFSYYSFVLISSWQYERTKYGQHS